MMCLGMAKGALRILLADDRDIVHRGLRELLHRRVNWRIVAETTNAALDRRRSLSSSQAKLLVCSIGLGVACIDWFSPADVNPAIFYSLVIGLCLWTRSSPWLWTATVIFASMSLVSYQFGSPPMGGHAYWVDSTNRYLTVCALFLVAALVQMRMRAEDALRSAGEQLEKRVAQRTHQLQQANAELLEHSKLVRELSGRLLVVQDEERRRVARELHDSVGQSLAAAGMQIAAVQAECSRLSPATAKAIAENAALIDEVQREIRTMSYLLHPPLLDEVGLRSALHWYIDGFAARSNIKTTLELPPDLARLPGEMELCIFRIAQECLTNIHRHSGSGVAAIRIAQQDGMLHVEVRDQGRGITPEKQLSLAATDKRGVGIPGMQERVRQFGGSLEIKSSASGTAVVAMFPLAPARGKEKIAVAASSKS